MAIRIAGEKTERVHEVELLSSDSVVRLFVNGQYVAFFAEEDGLVLMELFPMSATEASEASIRVDGNGPSKYIHCER